MQKLALGNICKCLVSAAKTCVNHTAHIAHGGARDGNCEDTVILPDLVGKIKIQNLFPWGGSVPTDPPISRYPASLFSNLLIFREAGVRLIGGFWGAEPPQGKLKIPN